MGTWVWPPDGIPDFLDDVLTLVLFPSLLMFPWTISLSLPCIADALSSTWSCLLVMLPLWFSYNALSFSFTTFLFQWLCKLSIYSLTFFTCSWLFHLHCWLSHFDDFPPLCFWFSSPVSFWILHPTVYIFQYLLSSVVEKLWSFRGVLRLALWVCVCCACVGVSCVSVFQCTSVGLNICPGFIGGSSYWTAYSW